jgi:hypothetical protein
MAQALYTFEIPAPQPETIRFICSTEEEAWAELIEARSTVGALAELTKIDPLTQTQVELAEIFELAMRAILEGSPI